METDDSIDAALAELEALLYGYNYSVSLKVFRVPFALRAEPEDYIVAALGEQAVIEGIQPVTSDELAADVEASLRYAGSDADGPTAENLKSARFNELFGCVLRHVAEKCQQSTMIVSFRISDGHPFYPVFWDFAYLMIAPGSTEIFIGSSSD